MARELPEGSYGIEDPMWYDGICCYRDTKGNFYSKLAHIPIASDEICKYGRIFKVKLIRDGKGPFDYHYEVLSSRPDEE